MTYATPGMPAPSSPQPPAAPARPSVLPPSRLFAVIFSLIALLVTAGAIALAAYAPQGYATNTDAAPTGWSQIYDANLSTADAAWDTSRGCDFSGGGLAVGSGGVCAFGPSTVRDLTSQGFLLRLTVAPAVDSPGDPQPYIKLGDSLFLGVSQLGQYSVCDTLNCSRTGQISIQGSSINWHGDEFVANTMAVKYDAQASLVTFYLNGVQVADASITLDSRTPLALAAPTNGAALFTHATLYSASS